MIGLDTRALIDLLKGNTALKEIIEKTQEPLTSTIINYQELLFGLDFENQRHLEEEKTYDSLFENIQLFSLTTQACKNAAQIFRKLQKKGLDIGRFDSIIAGILLENGVTKIITKNEKHFSRMQELTVLSY